ncbi:MAG: hypothetical protein IPM98_17100 [Lewinellaceae bacterium]|nr:hypothetical protein [Lewinellaceae bacterium]
MKKANRYAYEQGTGSQFSSACFHKILTFLVLFASGPAAPAQNFSPYLTGPYPAVGGKFFIRT